MMHPSDTSATSQPKVEVIMGFLDNVTASVNRGVASAGRTTETLKLKNQLNDINKQRQALAAQLGASLYEATRENVDFRSGREGLYEGIASLDAQREAVNAQIMQLEAQERQQQINARVYTCPGCGGRVAETDMFCATCGTPIAQVRAANAMPSPMLGQVPCPHCGSPMNQGDAFCMHCGTAVSH
jgi:DNA-directed RNA polymerase subunit RPC12/RpoP